MGFISFLEKNLLSCHWKQNYGVDCSGCGMQRSLIHLLKGEFTDAFFMYPAVYTLIAMLAYLALHLKFNFQKGHKILLYLFMINIVLIVGNFIYKTFN